jgi:predicted AAA+ superfamily ATPase
MKFDRLLKDKLVYLATKYPIVTVTGPRQSGKTTLCRECFPEKTYVNLETPDTRDFASSDPRGFLNRIKDGAVIDEIQRVPELVSYIQVFVDERKANGIFILTGSEQLSIRSNVSQSLAGRTALLRLLPLSLQEIATQIPLSSPDSLMFQGGYPRLYDQEMDPLDLYRDYIETYLQRDVRQLINIKHLSLFQKFIQLCAGRIGQLVNLTSLGNDVGVSHTTVREWLSILEASYVLFLLPPYFSSISKRLIKSPKLYFYDLGVATHLLRMRTIDDLATHPLRGNLFENLVVSEIRKAFFNKGLTEDMYFYRDSSGLEVDLLVGTGSGKYQAIEIKAGETVNGSFFGNLRKLAELLPANIEKSAFIFGGEEIYEREGINVMSWRELAQGSKFISVG